MGLRQLGQGHAFDMQRTVSVGDERLAGKLNRRAHLAADEAAAGRGEELVAAVAGVTAELPGNTLYGTLCGAKNKGPFWPQADTPAKASNKSGAVMIRSDKNIE